MGVAVCLVQAVVGELRRVGCDAGAVLAEVGIDAAALQQPWERVPVAAYDRLQRRALEVSRDPAFGLHMGEHASIGAFNLLGQMAMHSRTLGEGLDVLRSYHRIVVDVDPPALVYEGDRARLVYSYLRSQDPLCNRMRAEFGITALFTIARALGRDEPQAEFWFEHTRPELPEHAAEYRRIFEGRERFEAAHTGVVIPRELLGVALPYQDASLYELLKARADRMLGEFAARSGLARRIRDLIVQEDEPPPLEMDAMASRLGMSERSLRRHLQKEGRSYAEIVGEARAEVARRLLRHLTIQETAYRLGFSTANAFHRAFRRWTGQTPGEFTRVAGARALK